MSIGKTVFDQKTWSRRVGLCFVAVETGDERRWPSLSHSDKQLLLLKRVSLVSYITCFDGNTSIKEIYSLAKVSFAKVR